MLDKSYLPPDLKPHMEACGVDRAVIVEAGRDWHELNLWWLDLAERYPYVGALVAGCRLEQDNLTEWFDEYAKSDYFVGVRTAPATDPDTWDNITPEADRGLKELVRRDLSLDILVNHHGLAGVGKLAAQYPNLRIIVNHCGGPPFREGLLDEWQTNFRPLAALDNIVVKYSSFLLYTHPEKSIEKLRPMAAYLMETFGPHRLIWGSNWPVELRGGTYEEAFTIMRTCIEPLTEAERAVIFGGNAAKFYKVR